MQQRTNLKIPFALKDGEIVHVNDVERGLACGCICPACGTELIARKGRETQHHFAHHGKDACEHAYETTLHFVAKQVLLDKKRIVLPALIARAADVDLTGELIELKRGLIPEPKEFRVDNAVLEKRLGNIVPDVIVDIGGTKLLVEIAVTHFIDAEKERRIRELEVAAIEIDLSDKRGLSSFDEIAEAILNPINAFWIYSPKKEKAEKVLKQDLQRRLEAVEKRVRPHLEEYERIRNLSNYLVLESVHEAQMPDSVYLPEILQHFEVGTIEELPKWIGINTANGFIFDCHAKIWQAMVYMALVKTDPIASYVKSPGMVVKWLIEKKIPVHRSLPFLWKLKKKGALDRSMSSTLPSYKQAVEEYLTLLVSGHVIRSEGSRYGRYDWEDQFYAL